MVPTCRTELLTIPACDVFFAVNRGKLALPSSRSSYAISWTAFWMPKRFSSRLPAACTLEYFSNALSVSSWRSGSFFYTLFDMFEHNVFRFIDWFQKSDIFRGQPAPPSGQLLFFHPAAPAPPRSSCHPGQLHHPGSSCPTWFWLTYSIIQRQIKTFDWLLSFSSEFKSPIPSRVPYCDFLLSIHYPYTLVEGHVDMKASIRHYHWRYRQV